MEVWKYIEGTNEKHMISSLGRVKSFCGRINPERILIGGHDKKGYHFVNIRSNNKYRTEKVHRLVAKYFLPMDLFRPHVNHKNGIKYDNRVENLEWCTKQENGAHAAKLGLYKIGTDNYSSKLNPDSVKIIREQLKQGISQRKIAKMHNVKKHAIYGIAHGWTWKHVI